MIVGPTKLPSDGPHAKRCRGKAGRDSSPLEDEGGRVPKRHGVAAPSTARCETANCRGNAWSVSTNRGGLKPGFVRVRRVNLPERRSATTGQVASKGFSLPNAATSMARGYPASSGRATSAMGISVSVKALRASGSAHSGAITIKSLSRLSERTSEATARHSSTCGNRLEKKTFAPSSSSPKSGIASHKYLAWPVNVRMLIESGVKPRFEARTRAGREMASCPASTPTGEPAIQPDRGRPYKNQNGGPAPIRARKPPLFLAETQPAVAEPLADALAFTDTLICTEASACALSEEAKHAPTLSAASADRKS